MPAVHKILMLRRTNAWLLEADGRANDLIVSQLGLGSKMRPLAGRSTNRAFSAGRGRELSLWIAGSFSNLAANGRVQ
jgi:hypothetical protein